MESAIEDAPAAPSKYRVLEFSENHPYMLLSAVIILVLVIIWMFLRSKGYFGGDATGDTKPEVKSKKSKSLDDCEEEKQKVKDLVNEIDSKQKKNKKKSGDDSV